MMEIKHGNFQIPAEVMAALDESQIQVVLEDIADAARNHWIKVAGAGLTRTRQDYISGIQSVEMKEGVAVIQLVGVMPNLIEQGMPAMDMHDTLLGPNVPTVPVGERGKHQRKDGGFYRAIPFRHATPTANGVTGAPMGSQYDGHAAVADARALGRAVYNKAKKLEGSTSQPGGRTKWGDRLPGGLAPKLKPHHKSDIFAGMVRLEKTYKKATQSSYMTFRTISTGSDGWIRPRTEGRHFALEVEAFVRELAPQAFEAYVQSLKGQQQP